MHEFLLLKQQIPEVRRNVPLKKHTTFRIGGPAKYFFAAKTSGQIAKAVQVARSLKLPFFVLSGGSNVLMPDKGFSGLVIKIQNTKYTPAGRKTAENKKKCHPFKMKSW